MRRKAHRTVRQNWSLVREVERDARAAHRSLVAQLDYLARLGRDIERNRTFSEERIAQFLAGTTPLDHLPLQEKIAAIREVEKGAQAPEAEQERPKDFGANDRRSACRVSSLTIVILAS